MNQYGQIFLSPLIQNSWQSMRKANLKYEHEDIDELRKTSVHLEHRRGKFCCHLEVKFIPKFSENTQEVFI